MFYVYILYSPSADMFYVGQTSDVQKRLLEHNNPVEKSKFSAKYTPWKLEVCFMVSNVRADAMKVEKFIKAQKSKKFIIKLIDHKENPEFYDQLVHNIISHG